MIGAFGFEGDVANFVHESHPSCPSPVGLRSCTESKYKTQMLPRPALLTTSPGSAMFHIVETKIH
jgi:hypothetical protein